MADLALTGPLDLTGVLELRGADGGKVTADGTEVLVDTAKGDDAPPFVFPPPPAGPIDGGSDLVVVASLNQTVTARGKPVVTQGVAMQGSMSTWPGFVLRGTATVTVNGIPMNVVGDRATIFPSGGSGSFAASGQP